jgi:catechol 2,3-dioxygenase-like lactoylglutathione lyase family enzyme
MPQSSIGHLQFNVQPENLPYYRDLLAFLGWQLWHDTADMLGMGHPNGGASLWFSGKCNEVKNDYDGAGFNHLGLSVPNQEDVDATVDHLRNLGVTLLFDTPRHRPEFTGDEQSTYYQVMFETPDRILVEVVYMGPKAG